MILSWSLNILRVNDFVLVKFIASNIGSRHMDSWSFAPTVVYLVESFLFSQLGHWYLKYTTGSDWQLG